MAEKDALLDTKIGGCLLLQKIGQGGMGSVYMARQLSLDRVVALKILAPALAKDKGKRERFLKEAKSSAKLHHPNIIGIHSAGFDGGQCYYTMEYIEGGSVNDLITREGKIEEGRALEIIYDICQALQHAMQHKMLHRDIKPDNFMITRDKTIKLCDLGLAKILEGNAHQTQEGIFMGTPYFTSPEQAKGNSSIDIRSDLYSVGASLFNMLTGRYPFESSSPIGVITMHINDPAPLVSQYEPNITKATVALVDKLLRKDPKDRYQTPAEVMNAISEILRKYHKKNKSFRTSQQMPAVEDEIEESGSAAFIKPVVIGVVTLVIAYLVFSFLKPKPVPPMIPSDETPVETTINSGLAQSFIADKQTFLDLLEQATATSAIKKARYEELKDIYEKVLPEEIKALENVLEKNLDAITMKLLNNAHDKLMADIDLYIQRRNATSVYLLLVDIVNPNKKAELNELSKESLETFTKKVMQSRLELIDKVVNKFIPIPNADIEHQLNIFSDAVSKTNDNPNAVTVMKNALKAYAANKNQPNNKAVAKPIGDPAANTPNQIADKAVTLSNAIKQDIDRKNFVQIFNAYKTEKNNPALEKELQEKSPEILVAAKSIDRVYSDLSRNLQRLAEGEVIEINNTKYILTQATDSAIFVMKDQDNTQTMIPFDKIPLDTIQRYTYKMRDHDANLKLSYGVYTLMSGNKQEGTDLINAVDISAKKAFEKGLEILSR